MLGESLAKFSISGPGNVAEDSNAVFTVTMTGSISAPVSAWYSTLSGSASAGAGDYSRLVCEPATDVQSGRVEHPDDLYVEAFDGKAYSPWTEFHVFDVRGLPRWLECQFHDRCPTQDVLDLADLPRTALDEFIKRCYSK
jgi:hypothetical protein